MSYKVNHAIDYQTLAFFHVDDWVQELNPRQRMPIRPVYFGILQAKEMFNPGSTFHISSIYYKHDVDGKAIYVKFNVQVTHPNNEKSYEVDILRSGFRLGEDLAWDYFSKTTSTVLFIEKQEDDGFKLAPME